MRNPTCLLIPQGMFLQLFAIPDAKLLKNFQAG